VSLLSEGVPPLRSSSERRDALRRFLGEGSPALREDLQAVGDPVWPPPLVGLAVLVDEGALAVDHPLLARLGHLGAIPVVLSPRDPRWLAALEATDAALGTPEGSTLEWALRRGCALFRGTRGLAPSARGGDSLWCLAACAGDAVRLVDHLRAAPIPGDRWFVPHAEPRFLASFLAGPRPPARLLVPASAKLPGWWRDRPARRLLPREIRAVGDATEDETLARGVAVLDRLLEAGSLVGGEGRAALVEAMALARGANLPLASIEVAGVRVTLVGARFGDADLMRAVAWVERALPSGWDPSG